MPNKSWIALAALVTTVLIGLISTRASAEEPSKWECYVTERFPDYRAAASWKGALTLTDGLNVNASHVPSGTVLTFQKPAEILCVKK